VLLPKRFLKLYKVCRTVSEREEGRRKEKGRKEGRRRRKKRSSKRGGNLRKEGEEDIFSLLFFLYLPPGSAMARPEQTLCR
jgi:hypothetical protein